MKRYNNQGNQGADGKQVQRTGAQQAIHAISSTLLQK